ncbi:DUF1819 family protein [Sporosarcina sp. E16_8]|uniref:DUF1819 family protein n=1 Tax=Sporosarcina sp. E16_8 TaxID=2789295 RepID=UPI001A931983|nr:DUF1819 family protein [Sporosarcina sp. E16_8]MBO0589398.1 DUF1819 family protein [Sporosarcina sp. E16_8]
MMDYSAGFTSEGWFQHEIHIVLAYKQKGLNRGEILHEVIGKNLFQMRSESGIRKRFQMVYRRTETLSPSLVDYYLSGSRFDQKAIVLYSFLKGYRYAYEFFQEVIVLNYQSNKYDFQYVDLAYFLERKEAQSEKILNWHPDTKKRIGGILLRFFKEAELVEVLEKQNRIVPLHLSQNLKQYAEEHDPLLYLLCNLKEGE